MVYEKLSHHYLHWVIPFQSKIYNSLSFVLNLSPSRANIGHGTSHFQVRSQSEDNLQASVPERDGYVVLWAVLVEFTATYHPDALKGRPPFFAEDDAAHTLHTVVVHTV